LLVNAVECKECNTIIFSRTKSDLRECDCGRVMVSGGQEHFKYDVYTNPQYEIKKINIKASLKELYEDWYNMDDEFGLIKIETPEKDHPNVQVF